MLGTLVITDAKTVEEIENGKHTDLSCGYDCDIEDTENPQQRRIRGNHVALCEQGRAGIARIVDSVNDEESTYTEVTKNLEKEADKEYIPFSDSNLREKNEALERIRRIIKNKDNTADNGDGKLYLTPSAYGTIAWLVRTFDITQKDLEGISKYFFGRGGYNMFK